jgi:hypothetical protein
LTVRNNLCDFVGHYQFAGEPAKNICEHERLTVQVVIHAILRLRVVEVLVGTAATRSEHRESRDEEFLQAKGACQCEERVRPGRQRPRTPADATLDPIWVRTKGDEDRNRQIEVIGHDDPAPPDVIGRREAKDAADTGRKLRWVLRKVHEIFHGDAEKIGPCPDSLGELLRRRGAVEPHNDITCVDSGTIVQLEYT